MHVVATQERMQNVVEELALLKAKNIALKQLLIKKGVIEESEIESYEELYVKNIDKLAAELMNLSVHQYQKHKAEMNKLTSI